MQFSNRDIQNMEKVIDICSNNEEWAQFVPTLRRAKCQMIPETFKELNIDESNEKEIDEIIESLAAEVKCEKPWDSRTVRIIPDYDRTDKYGRYKFTLIGIGAEGLDFIDHVKSVGCWSDYYKSIAIDSEYHRVVMCNADYKIVPGKNEYGKSLKGNHELGAAVMKQSYAEIENALQSAGNKHAIVILNCGGACSGGVEVVFEALRKLDISFVTGAYMPFDYESQQRITNAQLLREKLTALENEIVFIDNSDIQKLLDRRSTIHALFELSFKEMIKKTMPDVFYRDYINSDGPLKNKKGELKNGRDNRWKY